jgi:hypothetical protein
LLNDPISLAPKAGHGGSGGTLELSGSAPGKLGEGIAAGAFVSGFFMGTVGGSTHVKSRGL